MEPVIKDGLQFDPALAEKEIERFIRREVRRFGKRGVVLGLSGGLDSTVCAYLCVHALGPSRVATYMLPERDTDLRNMIDAKLVIQQLGLRSESIDISPELEMLGVYDRISKEQAGNLGFIENGIRKIARLSSTPSAFITGIQILYDTRPNLRIWLARRIFWKQLGFMHAFTITKLRQRMIVLYHQALIKNYLVVGTTDRSEWSIGFYDPYGDGASDIMLLRHLYKTQIRELARYLQIPDRIINKPSSGDLAAGLPNESAVGLTYEQLDSILWGLDHKLINSSIIKQSGVTQAQINCVKKAIDIARLRTSLPSMLPMLP